MPIDDPAGVGIDGGRSAAEPPPSAVRIGEPADRPEARSRSWLRAWIDWAVDGQGQFLQGRAALGPAVLAMMLPLVANVIGMALFGYSRTSRAYEVMTWVTVAFWTAAAAYIAVYFLMTLHRLLEAILNLVRGRESRRKDWP